MYRPLARAGQEASGIYYLVMPDARGKVAACAKRRKDMDKAKKRKLPPAGAGFALALLLAALPGILLAAVGDIYRNDFNLVVTALPSGTCIIVR